MIIQSYKIKNFTLKCYYNNYFTAFNFWNMTKRIPRETKNSVIKHQGWVVNTLASGKSGT